MCKNIPMFQQGLPLASEEGCDDMDPEEVGWMVNCCLPPPVTAKRVQFKETIQECEKLQSAGNMKVLLVWHNLFSVSKDGCNDLVEDKVIKITLFSIFLF